MRLLLAASAAISALAIGAAAHAQPAPAYGYDQNGNPMGDYARGQDDGQGNIYPPAYAPPPSAPQYGQYGAQPYGQPQYGQPQYAPDQRGAPQGYGGRDQVDPQDSNDDQDQMGDQDAGDAGYGPPPSNDQGYAPPPPSYGQGQRGGMSTSPDPSWSAQNGPGYAGTADGSDLMQREMQLERHIRRAGERGAIPGYEADNLMVELSSIRAQQEELSRRDNGLNYTDRSFITNRLARLEGQFHQER